MCKKKIRAEFTDRQINELIQFNRNKSLFGNYFGNMNDEDSAHKSITERLIETDKLIEGIDGEILHVDIKPERRSETQETVFYITIYYQGENNDE